MVVLWVEYIFCIEECCWGYCSGVRLIKVGEILERSSRLIFIGYLKFERGRKSFILKED